jgi:hypothetical protein
MELEEMMKITSLYRQMDQSLLMLQLASKPLCLLQINNHHSTIHGAMMQVQDTWKSKKPKQEVHIGT